MTKAERYARYVRTVKNPPTFKFPKLSLSASVSLSGNLEFNAWPHIPAEDIPAFIEWLRETFIYDDAPF